MELLMQSLLQQTVFEYIKDEQPAQIAKINFDNGDTYVGEVHNIFQKPNGPGTLKTSTAEHTGLFRKGVFLCGTSIFSNGVVHTGSWEKGKKSGEGTLKCANGDYYQGYFVNNLYEGSGKLVYNTRSTYEGAFKKGFREGKGVYQSYSGGMKGFSYEGEWKADCFQGEGILCYFNGDVYKGSFKNNNKEGYGCFQMSNGNIYEGQFRNNLYHGQGRLVLRQSQIVYEGKFQKGLFHGEGKIESSNVKFEGTFKNGKFDGQNKQSESNSNIQSEVFQNKSHNDGIEIFEKGQQETKLFVVSDSGVITSSGVFKE